MKTRFKIIFMILLGTALFGCSKSDPEKLERVPTIDARLAGYWKLKSPNDLSIAGVKAPNILKLGVNRNGLRQADFCNIGGQTGQGMSGYEINDKELLIKFFTFQNPDQPLPNELPTTENIFSGQITKLNDDTLEIDKIIIFKKFTPSESLTHPNNLECEQ